MGDSVKSGVKALSFAMGLFVFVLLTPHMADAATITWTDAEPGDSNWSSDGNWSGSVVPTASDDVIFDGVVSDTIPAYPAYMTPQPIMGSLSFENGYTAGGGAFPFGGDDGNGSPITFTVVNSLDSSSLASSFDVSLQYSTLILGTNAASGTRVVDMSNMDIVPITDLWSSSTSISNYVNGFTLTFTAPASGSFGTMNFLESPQGSAVLTSVGDFAAHNINSTSVEFLTNHLTISGSLAWMGGGSPIVGSGTSITLNGPQYEYQSLSFFGTPSVEVSVNDLTIADTGSRDLDFTSPLKVEGIFTADLSSGNEVTIGNGSAARTINMDIAGGATYGTIDYVEINNSVLQEDGSEKDPALDPPNSVNSGSTGNPGWFTVVTPTLYYASGDSYDLSSANLAYEDTALSALGIDFNEDGTLMYRVESDPSKPAKVIEYSLSTPYDPATAVATGDQTTIVFELGSIRSPLDFRVAHDGSSLIAVGSKHPDSAMSIIRLDLDTPYTLSGRTLANTSDWITPPNTYERNFSFNADGTKLYTIDTFAKPSIIREYTLGAPYQVEDFIAANETATVSVPMPTDYAAVNMEFNNDGTRVFVTSSDFTNAVSQIEWFDLAGAYDISTLTAVDSWDTTSEYGAYPRDFSFNHPDGTKIITTNVRVYGGGGYPEVAANDGMVDNSTPLVITLVGDTFTGTNGDDFVDDAKVTVGNVPAGLTAVLSRDSDTEATLTFTGTADDHANADDVANLTFIFDDSALTGADAAAVTNSGDATAYDSNVGIDFADNAEITLEKTAVFNDNVTSDGVAQEGETITYTFLVENTGNLPITGASLTDTTIGVGAAQTGSVQGEYLGFGGPGEEWSIEGTGGYTPQVGDYVNGYIPDEFGGLTNPVNGTITALTPGGPGGTFYVEGLSGSSFDPAPWYGSVTEGNPTGSPFASPLASNATDTITFDYTLTAADILAGEVTNQATVTGKDPSDADVTDLSDDPAVTPGDDDATVTTLITDGTPPVDPTDLPDLVTASDTGTNTTDNETNDDTPTFDVECTEIGATINLYSDSPAADTLIGSHSCVAVATEEATVGPGTLADGTHNITYTNEDAAGNESGAAGPLEITIDTDVDAPTVNAPTAGGTTNGTVSGSGGQEGDTVTVTVQTTGETCSATVDSSGDWSCALVATPADGPIVIDVNVGDPSGNTAGPTTVNATVDNDAPSDPTAAPDLLAGSDTGTDDADNLTNDNTPEMSVECTETGATVNIYSDNPAANTLLGTHTCAGTGQETTTIATTIPNGIHNITTTVEDPAGNESGPTPATAITIDALPDVAPGTPDLTDGSDTGSSNEDDYTSDNTPTIDVSCADGSTVTLYTDNPAADTVLGSALCASGTASITPAAAIAESGHNFTTTQEDPAGNTSPASPVLGVVVVDTIEPGIPMPPDLQAGSDTGASDADNITADDTPSFDVTCTGIGNIITLYVDGSANGTHTCAAVAVETATIATAIPTGTVTITYSETDLAGNESDQTTGLGITVDATGPADPTVAPDLQAGSDTGSDTADNITSVNTPVIDVTCINGETVNLYTDNPVADTLAATHLCTTDGTEAVTVTTFLPDGPNNITYQLENTAGGTSASSPALLLTVDTGVTPAPGTPNLTDASDLGDSDSDNITSDSTPDFTVTCETGNTVELFAGAASLGSATCIAGVATITGVSLPETTVSITAIQTDPAGNGSASSPALDVTIDVTEPVTPTVTPDLDTGSDTGSDTGDDTTSDNTPEFTVSCTEVGNVVTLYVDGVANGTLTCTLDDVNDDPEPTITVTTPIPDGTVNITFSEMDPSGNEGPESTPLPVTIDTVALAPTINGPTNGGPVTGTAEPGSSVTISTPTSTCTVDPVPASGAYSCDLSPTPTTGEDIEALITDPSGNTSTTTTETSGIDTSIPSDNDGDGISDAIEDSVAPGGDGNGDGIADSLQSDVTSVVNPETGAYTTLEAANGCTVIGGYNVVAESSLAVQDEGFDYPVGLNDFTLICLGNGDSSDVTYYYDKVYDTAAWNFKKYDDTGNEYSDISSLVTYGTSTVSGTEVTTARYTVTDGGITDTDGVANGVIVDPAGPAVAGTIPVYRFWSETYRAHFYTKSELEKDSVIADYDDSIWRYEGVAFYAFSEAGTNRSVVHRFWSPTNRSHFYTISEAEKAVVESNSEWEYEGEEWYAYANSQSSSKTMYRFWSENYRSHFYTTSEAERDSVIANDTNWAYEGAVYHVPTS